MIQKIKKVSIIIFIFLFSSPVFASIPPSPLSMPLYVHGAASINGSQAPDGTAILAKNNTIEIASSIVKDGNYHLDIPAENAGSAIDYFLDGKLAASVVAADPMVEPAQEINLSITTTPASPAPAPSSGGSGGGGGSSVLSLTNLSVLINNGDFETDNGEIILSLSASGASQMMISDTPNFSGANWEKYVTRRSWNLGSAPGEKTVYVKFKGASGNISSIVSDSIRLISKNQQLKETEGEGKSKIKVLGVEADWRTIQLQRILADAKIIYSGSADLICGQTGVKRNVVEEANDYSKYAKPLISGIKGLAQNNIYTITNFIAYGMQSTKILGAGERAGVLNSYKAAFKKLPKTETEWQDVIKIANGRWPNERSAVAESQAKEQFKVVYLRQPDMNNPHDNAAVTIIAYGLRPDVRNLDSEKAGIKIFKHIYGYNPSSAVDWDIARAIAYSGAIR